MKSRLTLVAALLCGPALFGQWRNGYLDGQWSSPISALHYRAFTHITHSHVQPVNGTSTTTLDTTTFNISRDALTLTSTAHANGVAVILSVLGGANMATATDSTHLSSFVDALMSFATANGYDGIDIDWEGSMNTTQYTNLVTALRARLNAYTTPMGGKGLLTGFFGPMSTAVANWNNLDQVNVSCYDNIDWSLQTVWHNDALYDPSNLSGGFSCTSLMQNYVNAGIPKSKLGVGIPFYGYLWVGGTDASGNSPYYPGQKLTTPASGVRQKWYSTLVNDPTVWQPQYQKRDSGSGNVPYLSINNGGLNNTFISYDDPASINAKWNFVASNGYAGATVWAIGMDYMAGGTTPAEQHPLAQALLLAVQGNTAPVISSTSPLPAGTQGVAYSTTLTASGTAPTWSVTSGTLPAGLSLSNSGVISGTPTTAGTSTFTVTASNTAGSNSKSLSLTISTAVAAPVITSTSPLPGGTQGAAYSTTLTASGTTPTWSVTSGTLPAGLSLSGTGVIGGTPTTAGTSTFTVTAANSAGSNSKSLSLTISAVTSTFNPIRVNAGAGSFTDSTGTVWAADTGYSASATYTTSSGISNTTTATLYKSERYQPGGFSYNFAVPNGTYAVKLKFAEIYYTQKGKRVFNASLNGQQVLSNFDIVAAAGAGFTAIDKAFTANVTGGKITIQFTAVIENPKVSAIEITAGSAPAPVTMRINSGGGSYADNSGVAWSADNGYSGGGAYSTASFIANTNNPTVYQSERFQTGGLSYKFTVPNGTYKVNLKFAEIYFTTAGSRVFNVSINGQQVLKNFDIVAAAGGAFTALDKAFTTSVTNGAITITFSAVVENPKVSGIEIVSQ